MSPIKYLKSLLFWQTKTDYFQLFSSRNFGKKILILSNYIIWLFFLFISCLLVLKSPSSFWQIFIAIFFSELIEKYLKVKSFWKRPFNNGRNRLPAGFLQAWYHNGSFPSGHSIKAVIFLLFIIQLQVFSPVIFILATVPLLLFRVLVGLHYPVDVIGGGLIGLLIWLPSSRYLPPESMVKLVSDITKLFIIP